MDSDPNFEFRVGIGGNIAPGGNGATGQGKRGHEDLLDSIPKWATAESDRDTRESDRDTQVESPRRSGE